MSITILVFGKRSLHDYRFYLTFLSMDRFYLTFLSMTFFFLSQVLI